MINNIECKFKVNDNVKGVALHRSDTGIVLKSKILILPFNTKPLILYYVKLSTGVSEWINECYLKLSSEIQGDSIE